MYDIGISFEPCHESGLKQRCLEVVPFLAFSVAGILSGEYLRALAVVAVIAGTLGEEPGLRTVEMFVHKVCSYFLHLRPEEVKLFTFGIRA